jgi:protocatechuate 3,4-dioxygenase beta subunit
MKSPAHTPHFDGGLPDDLYLILQQNLQRRQALSWLLAGGSAALLVGCGGGSSDSAGSSGSSSSSGGSGTTACIASASETAGPYPSDGSNTVSGMVSNVLQQSGVVRSDIRSSFGSASGVAGGVPMTLKLSLVNSNNSCAVLSGYAVYLWHCSREGAYSLYTSGVQNENYLRGVQVTDANGEVTFTSIFPGCYAGRYPHIHFEVYPGLAMATLYTNRILTSQMALPRDACNAVYAGAIGYAQSVANLSGVTIANDGVFADNTTAQIAQMTPAFTGSVAAGYSGTVLVGVPV